MPGSILFKTTDDGTGSSVTRLTIAQSGVIQVADTASLFIPDSISHSGDADTLIRFPAANTFTVETGGTEGLRIDSSQNATFAGTVSDSKGNLRSIPQVGSLSANYTLATSDTGKHILTNAKDITVPNSTFAAGDAITLVNNSTTPTSIVKSITNLYNPADGTTPTALAAKGMCTILFVSGTEAYISGAGLS